MARNKLTNTQIQAASKPGRLSDGDGLYLSVSKTGSKSWAFMWTRNGRRREMGLGSLDTGTATVSLAVARQKADEIRAILGQGGDPFRDMEERKAAIKKVTFGEVAEDTIEALKPTWRNDKSEAQWRMTLLENYAKAICSIPVDEVTTEDVVRVLKPIWQNKAETARRLRARIEKVFDNAGARGLRSGDNPARLKGHLDHILPQAQKSKKNHHPALPYKQMPMFMDKLRGAHGIGARALELTILCATRTSETLLATWDEINFEDAIWTIPAERMKALEDHRIPLTVSAISILKEQYQNRMSDYVFPGQSVHKSISNMTMSKALKAIVEEHVTVHGFRSSFRDWAGEETSHPREVAEQALAHVVGSDVERAYRRGDALEKRRKLMEAWASYLSGNTKSIRLVSGANHER